MPKINRSEIDAAVDDLAEHKKTMWALEQFNTPDYKYALKLEKQFLADLYDDWDYSSSYELCDYHSDGDYR